MKKWLILLFIAATPLAPAFANSTTVFTQENGQLITENDEMAQFGVDTTTFAEEEAPSYSGTLTKMMISLVIVIVLAIATLIIFRKLIRGRSQIINNNKSIKILERRVLSPKSALYLIEVNNEKVLISESHVEVRPIQALEMQQKGF